MSNDITIKISELPNANPPVGSEIFPVVQAGATRRLAISQLLASANRKAEREHFQVSDTPYTFTTIDHDPLKDIIFVFVNGSLQPINSYSVLDNSLTITEPGDYEPNDDVAVVNMSAGVTFSSASGSGNVSLDSALNLASISPSLARGDLSYTIKTIFDFSGEIYGGGDFIFDESRDKSDHNGWSVIALGSSGANWVQFNEWTGSGQGCFIRQSEHDSPAKRIKMSLFNRMANGFKVIAHRGRRLAPENTIAGLYDLPRGAFAVEIDTRITSDGHIVLMHDSTVNRTTDGSGSVSSLTLSQIKAMDAGSWVHPFYAGARVPTLKEYLIAAFEKGISLVIVQAKVCENEEQAQKYVDIIEDLNCWDRVVIGDSPSQFKNIRRVSHKALGVTFSNAENILTERIKLMVGLQGSIALTPPGNSGFDNNQGVYQAMFENGVIAGTSTNNSIARIRKASAETSAKFCLTDLYDHALDYEV